MANIVLANVAASVSELKRNPMGTVAAGEGFPVVNPEPQRARLLLRTGQGL